MREIIGAVIAIILFAGCKKMTDDHNEVIDPSLTKTLMEVIEENASLSTFAGYLRQTGLDKELNSSRPYTVFAPTNDKLVGIDNAILSNPTKLKAFIANHITSHLYRTTSIVTPTRIAMLSGKYNDMLGDDAKEYLSLPVRFLQ